MSYFSVAPQTVTDPATGYSVRFEVDPNDAAICTMCAYVEDDTDDYLRVVFNRNGFVKEVVMVDAEAEEDARLRKEAEARQARLGAAPVAATPEDKKAAEEAAAKQAEADKALLASPPKVSKYAIEDEKAAADKAPAPYSKPVSITEKPK